MAPTIKEVAERAQVSVSTVSRVLNDYPFVSDSARRRVTEAMQALDYRPDMSARSMRTGTTRAVGFVVSDITNPVFAAIAKGADAVFHPHGYSLVLANSGGDPHREAELIAALRQRRVDGLIAAVADERAPGLAERLGSARACVLFDREVAGSGADAVCSDHGTGMEAALAHLAELGHVRVGLIAGMQSQLGSRARVAAYRRLAPRLGLDRGRELVVTGRLSRETGYRGARELLALPSPPTALIAGNNQLTVGALAALRELGVDVPGELSLVACDDVDLTRLHDPPLDVVDRDPEAHGRAAAELLLRRLEDRHAPPRRVVLPTSFVRRASSGAPVTALGAATR
jgi:LacI family transcriptional regulator